MIPEAASEALHQPSPPPPSLNNDCQHRIKETDPETGRTFCRECGCEIPDEPVIIGGRVFPPTQWLREAAVQYRKLEAEQKQKLLEAQRIQDKKNMILSIAGDLQNTKCHWPGCTLKPRLRSKWCEDHKTQRDRETARDRQQRHRERLSRVPAMSRLPLPVY